MKQVKIEADKIEDYESKFEEFTKNENSAERPIAIHYSEKQKTLLWIRVYLKSELDINPNDSVSLEYAPTSEKISTRFVCYGKTGADKDGGEFISSYNPEDDKKVLCLSVESDTLNDSVSTIRAMFKNTIYFEYQLLRRNELIFTYNGSTIEYYDTEF